MRRMTITVALLCAMSMAALGQQTNPVKTRSNIKNNIALSQGADGKVMCTEQAPKPTSAVASTSKPCTEDQVKQFRATYSTTRSNIRNLVLAPDGTLRCDGKTCTGAQLKELNNAAAAMTVGDPISGAGVGLGKKSNPK